MIADADNYDGKRVQVRAFAKAGSLGYGHESLYRFRFTIEKVVEGRR